MFCNQISNVCCMFVYDFNLSAAPFLNRDNAENIWIHSLSDFVKFLWNIQKVINRFEPRKLFKLWCKQNLSGNQFRSLKSSESFLQVLLYMNFAKNFYRIYYQFSLFIYWWLLWLHHWISGKDFNFLQAEPEMQHLFAIQL